MEAQDTPRLHLLAHCLAPSCHNCGTKREETPAMRRGPQGNGMLCNACGLYWRKTRQLRIISHLENRGRGAKRRRELLGTLYPSHALVPAVKSPTSSRPSAAPPSSEEPAPSSPTSQAPGAPSRAIPTGAGVQSGASSATRALASWPSTPCSPGPSCKPQSGFPQQQQQVGDTVAAAPAPPKPKRGLKSPRRPLQAGGEGLRPVKNARRGQRGADAMEGGPAELWGPLSPATLLGSTAGPAGGLLEQAGAAPAWLAEVFGVLRSTECSAPMPAFRAGQLHAMAPAGPASAASGLQGAQEALLDWLAQSATSQQQAALGSFQGGGWSGELQLGMAAGPGTGLQAQPGWTHTGGLGSPATAWPALHTAAATAQGAHSMHQPRWSQQWPQKAPGWQVLFSQQAQHGGHASERPPSSTSHRSAPVGSVQHANPAWHAQQAQQAQQAEQADLMAVLGKLGIQLAPAQLEYLVTGLRKISHTPTTAQQAQQAPFPGHPIPQHTTGMSCTDMRVGPALQGAESCNLNAVEGISGIPHFHLSTPSVLHPEAVAIPRSATAPPPTGVSAVLAELAGASHTKAAAATQPGNPITGYKRFLGVAGPAAAKQHSAGAASLALPPGQQPAAPAEVRMDMAGALAAIRMWQLLSGQQL